MPDKTHVKPTPEELEANAQKAIEEAEALKNKEVEEPEEPEAPEDPEPEPKPEPENEAELKRTKEKLRASSREAQILYARNKQVQEAIEKASSLPDPTDEELQAEYPDWDVMSDFEKKMAKESMSNSRRMQAITEVNKQFKDLEAWQNQVDAFIDDPATITNNPALAGIEDDFREFATKPTRRGVDFDILISSFLYEYDKQPTKPKKKQMFPRSAGSGEAPKPKSNKLTVEQGRALRESNYDEYKRQLLAGNIETEQF